MCCIGASARCHQESLSPTQVAALQEFLTDEEIETICRQLDHTWRDRKVPAATTVRSMIYRGLHPDKSIKALLADMFAADERLQTAPTDAAWCQAKSRLPEELFTRLIQRSSRRAINLAGDQYLYVGRPVYLVDGSTVSMPDEPEMVEEFGYANTKHGLSRFPVAKITFVVRADVEAICNYRLGPYPTDENTHFHQMWHQIPRGAICIFDRHFSSFYNLAKLRQRRIDVISRLHPRRDPSKLIARGRPIGKNEWIVRLDLAASQREKYDDPSLPQFLRVRLIRLRFQRKGKRRHIWIITTLLDAQRYSRCSITKLHRRRWGVETRIGSLKTTLEMTVLRSKTVKAVRYEVAATVLAHNLV